MWAWRRLRPRSDDSDHSDHSDKCAGFGIVQRLERRLVRWPERPPVPAPLRLGIRPAVSAHPTAAVDYVLAQATALLVRARAARDGVEVQRLLQWIDARLDERLRLTRSSS